MRRHSFAAAGLAAALAFLAGCGGGPDATYRVSGKATFKGQPIQNGQIYFDPDLAKKSTGRQGFAEIKDGAYDTSVSGKSPSGGPYIVRIEAFEGVKTSPDQALKPLFGYFQQAVELPKEATTKDFDVPASAIKARPPGGGRGGP